MTNKKITRSMIVGHSKGADIRISQGQYSLTFKTVNDAWTAAKLYNMLGKTTVSGEQILPVLKRIRTEIYR